MREEEKRKKWERKEREEGKEMYSSPSIMKTDLGAGIHCWSKGPESSPWVWIASRAALNPIHLWFPATSCLVRLSFPPRLSSSVPVLFNSTHSSAPWTWEAKSQGTSRSKGPLESEQGTCLASSVVFIQPGSQSLLPSCCFHGYSPVKSIKRLHFLIPELKQNVPHWKSGPVLSGDSHSS